MRVHTTIQRGLGDLADAFSDGGIDGLEIRISYPGYPVETQSERLRGFLDNIYVLAEIRNVDAEFLPVAVKVAKYEFSIDHKFTKGGFFVFVAKQDETERLMSALAQERRLSVSIELSDGRAYEVELPKARSADFSTVRAMYETCKVEHAGEQLPSADD